MIIIRQEAPFSFGRLNICFQEACLSQAVGVHARCRWGALLQVVVCCSVCFFIGCGFWLSRAKDGEAHRHFDSKEWVWLWASPCVLEGDAWTVQQCG